MRIFKVGGAVRDRLLGLAPGDEDFVVVGATVEAMLALGYRQVGADFPVFLHPHTAQEYALARTERKSAPGYRGFIVHASPEVTLEEDLRRRDFTLNAIAEDEHGVLIDPLGGRADIEQRWLRHCGPAFIEDPLRVLRAARFMARFAPLGFRVAEETRELMRAMVDSGELGHLVPERVWQELRRALSSAKPSAFLRALRDCGALHQVLPEVDALYGVEQRAEFHPEIDAGIHTEMVCDMAAMLAPGNARIGFAALTHDLGKALTPIAQRPKHIGHELSGLAPLRTLALRLKIPNDHLALAETACREHLNIHRFDELRDATVVELLQRCDAFRLPQRIEELALVCEADKRGRLGLQDIPYPQGGNLIACLHAALEVKAGELIAPGMSAERIQEVIRKAREAAVKTARGRDSNIG